MQSDMLENFEYMDDSEISPNNSTEESNNEEDSEEESETSESEDEESEPEDVIVVKPK